MVFRGLPDLLSSPVADDGSFTCTEISLDFIWVAPVKQPNGNSVLVINTRPFICFICIEVRREWTTLFSPFVQILLSNWKWRYFIKKKLKFLNDKIHSLVKHLKLKLEISTLIKFSRFYFRSFVGVYKGKIIKLSHCPNTSVTNCIYQIILVTEKLQ